MDNIEWDSPMVWQYKIPRFSYSSILSFTAKTYPLPLTPLNSAIEVCSACWSGWMFQMANKKFKIFFTYLLLGGLIAYRSPWIYTNYFTALVWKIRIGLSVCFCYWDPSSPSHSMPSSLPALTLSWTANVPPMICPSPLPYLGQWSTWMIMEHGQSCWPFPPVAL